MQMMKATNCQLGISLSISASLTSDIGSEIIGSWTRKWRKQLTAIQAKGQALTISTF